MKLEPIPVRRFALKRDPSDLDSQTLGYVTLSEDLDAYAPDWDSALNLVFQKGWLVVVDRTDTRLFDGTVFLGRWNGDGQWRLWRNHLRNRFVWVESDHVCIRNPRPEEFTLAGTLVTFLATPDRGLATLREVD